MVCKKTILFILLNVVLDSIFLFGQPIPARPQDYVNQYNTRLLSSNEQKELSSLLKSIDEAGVAQIVVAVFDSYGESTPEEFTIKLAEQWKIGHKGKDNGIIIAVFEKERTVRIEVGYGLEGVVTDAESWRIIQKIMIPAFREGNYFEGLRGAVQELYKLMTGNYLGDYQPMKRRSNDDSPVGILIFIIIIIILQVLFGRRRGMIYTSGGRRSYGGFGGFGGFGGGGGFSGGGGSFGGGGATGRW